MEATEKWNLEVNQATLSGNKSKLPSKHKKTEQLVKLYRGRCRIPTQPNKRTEPVRPGGCSA